MRSAAAAAAAVSAAAAANAGVESPAAVGADAHAAAGVAHAVWRGDDAAARVARGHAEHGLKAEVREAWLVLVHCLSRPQRLLTASSRIRLVQSVHCIACLVWYHTGSPGHEVAR